MEDQDKDNDSLDLKEEEKNDDMPEEPSEMTIGKCQVNLSMKSTMCCIEECISNKNPDNSTSYVTFPKDPSRYFFCLIKDL